MRCCSLPLMLARSLPYALLLFLAEQALAAPATFVVIRNGGAGMEVVLDTGCPTVERDVAHLLIDQFHLPFDCS